MRWNKPLYFFCDPGPRAVESMSNNQWGLHPWQQKRREWKMNSIEILMFHTAHPTPEGRGFDSTFNFNGAFFASPGWGLSYLFSSAGGCFIILLLCPFFKTNWLRPLNWILSCDWITGSRAIWRTQTRGCEGEQRGAGPRHPQRAQPDRTQQPRCQRARTHSEGASLPGQGSV